MQYTEYELGELLPFEQPTAYIVKSTDYCDAYATPVLTAGKSFILGKTNETDGIFDQLPVIIFDDFTTATQFVNFRFKVKSSAMKILHINTDLVIPKYIFYRLQIIQFDHSTHKRYWIQSYSKIKVLIPPLDEQFRIVARIEELFSELDKAVDTLKTTKEQLEVYRQAVLKDAFSDFEKKDSIRNLTMVVTSGSRGWAKYYSNSGALFVRIGNLTHSGIDIDFRDIQHITPPDNAEGVRTRLQPNDVLVSITADLGSIGFVSEKVEEAYINQHIALVRFQNPVQGRFMAWYLRSEYGQKDLLKNKRGGGKLGLGLDDIRDTPVPIVSDLVAQKTVDEIEERLSVCDSIEKTVDATLAQADAMRQSILKQSFEEKI